MGIPAGGRSQPHGDASAHDCGLVFKQSRGNKRRYALPNSRASRRQSGRNRQIPSAPTKSSPSAANAGRKSPCHWPMRFLRPGQKNGWGFPIADSPALAAGPAETLPPGFPMAIHHNSRPLPPETGRHGTSARHPRIPAPACRGGGGHGAF